MASTAINNSISTTFDSSIINGAITGYFAEDRWNILNCPLLKDKWKGSQNRWLVFETFRNESLKNEVKYYFYSNLIHNSLSPTTLWSNYSTILITLGNFLNIHYPNLKSLIGLPLEEFIGQLRVYMISIGKPVEKKRYLTESNLRWQSSGTSESIGLTAARSIYNYLYSVFNVKSEIELDRWDVRKLGLDFNITNGSHYIDFNLIPSNFKEFTKSYFKLRLIDHGDLSWASAVGQMIILRTFFAYINSSFPHWCDLKCLSRADILGFIEYLRTQPMGGNSAKAGQKPTEKYIYRTLSATHSFLQYIQTIGFDEAPDKLVNTLILLSEDVPRQKRRNEEAIQYIPDYVWEQVVENISSMASDTIPIILVLEATGFRICDVLQLRQNCLLEQEDGFWIEGRQRKTKHINHKVPVSKEIADIIKSQITFTNEALPFEQNKQNYLFPVLTGRRRGIPPLNSTITRRLNDMAFKCGITDTNGNIYWFKSHSFRHRYGVNLVNNGMNIYHIQKLMAHACPEITLHYAKLHDKSLRDAWENARNSTAIKLDDNGFIVSSNIESAASENGLELEWIRHNLDSVRLDHGYCIKAPSQQCDYLETTLDPPCIKNKCRSFHVDQTFIDYYQKQISIMQTDINTYNNTGRYRSIEIIKPRLEKFQKILERLLNNQPLLGMNKSSREYVANERSSGK
ncbi:recombinase XerD [Paenibacillus sp. 79R4]|uniref:tyrosine-type recombinase/integrase n=1 Tax=Paenibacillus sp. 79R4 TaxID=2212847 RepID=UPI0015C0E32E|nr:tyrosine-type recombinase/integrase [Paenibacillus sp. 79R4]NWL87481.1 recombinase XerD [Paenibacillus sp. 79R4]